MKKIIKVRKTITISMATSIFYDIQLVCLGSMVYMLKASSSPVSDAKRYDEASA